MNSGDSKIQKMLVQRLERQVESLEAERDRLTDSLNRLASESVARVYLIETERDDALAKKRSMEEFLASLDEKLAAAESGIRSLRSELRALRPNRGDGAY